MTSPYLLQFEIIYCYTVECKVLLTLKRGIAMNKKAIFMSFLLLMLQPNRILGANDGIGRRPFNELLELIERRAEALIGYDENVYPSQKYVPDIVSYSDGRDIEKLLQMAITTENDLVRTYDQESLRIIKDNYGQSSIRLVDQEEAIKG